VDHGLGLLRAFLNQLGLQAHSCYSYQGQIAVDQAFDKNLLKQNSFSCQLLMYAWKQKAVSK